MNNSRTLGIISGVIGILLFSSKAVMVKLAYQYEIDSISILLLRMGFALPFYVVVALFNRPQSKPTRKDYLWLVGLGFVGYYLASYFDFYGLKFIKASLERLILFVYPTLVVLISYLIFRRRITKNQTIGIFVTYLGIFIIFGTELQLGEQSNVLRGGFFVFLSAVTYASYLVGSGWLIPTFGSKVFTAYAMIVSCLAVILHFGITDSPDLLSHPSEVYLIGFLMAVFATVVPTFLISYAIKKLGASTFSIFGSLGPVSTIGLAYIFLDERITMLQMIGVIVILFGIYIAEKKRRTQNA